MHRWRKFLIAAGSTAVVATAAGCGSTVQSQAANIQPILVSKSGPIAAQWTALLPRTLTRALVASLGPSAEVVLGWNPTNYFASGTPRNTQPWDPVLYVLRKSSAGWKVAYQNVISQPGTPEWLYVHPAGNGRVTLVSDVMNLSGDGYGGYTATVDTLTAAGTGQRVHAFAFGPGMARPVTSHGVFYLVGGYHAVGLTWGGSGNLTWHSYAGNEFPQRLPLAGKPVTLHLESKGGQGPLGIGTVTGVSASGTVSGGVYHLSVPAASNLVFLPSSQMAASPPGAFSVYGSLGDIAPYESNASATWSEVTGPLQPGAHRYLLTYTPSQGSKTLSLSVEVQVQ